MQRVHPRVGALIPKRCPRIHEAIERRIQKSSWMGPDEVESFALLLVHVSNLAQPVQFVAFGRIRCRTAPPRPNDFYVRIVSQPKLQPEIGLDRHKSSEGGVVSRRPRKY